MIDDRSGIDRLRAVVDEVSATLGPPAARTAPRWLVPGAATLAGLTLVAATLWWVRGTAPFDAPPPAGLGIEVKQLRLRGQDIDSRVFDAPGGGTIVVAPRQRTRTAAGPAVVLLRGGN